MTDDATQTEAVKALKEKYSKDKSVKKWRDYVKFGKKPDAISMATEQNHYYALDRFCRWSGKSPDELIKMRNRDIEDLLKAYWNDSGSALMVIGSMKSFFVANHKEIKLPPLNYEPKNHLSIKKEDIARMVEVSDLRTKVAILFLFQSTLRDGEFLRLKYKNIKPDFEAGRTPLRVWIVSDEEIRKNRIKIRHRRYDPYVGKETYEALVNYFASREKGTDKIHPEVITDESPILRQISSPKPVNVGSLDDMIRRVGLRIGLVGMKPHLFRGASQTALETAEFEGAVDTAKIPKNWVDYLVGHKPRGASAKHYSYPEEKLREAYQKAEPFLSLRAVSSDDSVVKKQVFKTVAKVLNIDIEGIIKRKGLVNIDDLSDEELESLFEDDKKILQNVALSRNMVVNERESVADTAIDTSITNHVSKVCDSYPGPYDIVEGEHKLIEYLNKGGWGYEAELPGGKFLVKRTEAR